MLLGFVGKLRRNVKRIAEKHPLTIFLSEFFLTSMPILLPHDNDYYGFCLLANKKHGLFLDVGANDGRSALSFHKLKKDWSIFSIEANPVHRSKFNKIKSSIPKLDFIIRAASNVTGKNFKLYIPIYYFYSIHTATSSDLESLKRHMKYFFGKKISNKFRYKEINVESIKIDDLNLAPDIIKIDVEGHEMDVLRGCEQTIKRCLPYFLIEYNKNDFEEIKKFFLDRNYHIYGFELKNMKFSEFSKNKFNNCFFIPSGIDKNRICN